MREENIKIPSYILFSLFRDEIFHKLGDENGGEFYFDLFDEVLREDKEFNFYFPERPRIDDKKKISYDGMVNETADTTFRTLIKILTPYVEEIKKQLKKLADLEWIELEKKETCTFDTIDKDFCEKQIQDGEVVPPGYSQTILLKIKTKKVKWIKFIEYAVEKQEGKYLDWDNLYGEEKQKTKLLGEINQQRTELEKDKGIICQFFKLYPFEGERIHRPSTLKILEKENYLKIDGVGLFNFRNSREKELLPTKEYTIKAKISLMNKFVDYFQKEILAKDKIIKKTTEINKKYPLTPIKNVRLSEKNYLLEINNGDRIISFKSKKSGRGLEKETKQFKVLFYFWDFRWELNDGKISKKGGIISLENLTRASGSESMDAAYKHIQRLNNRFKKEGVAIEIKGENGNYRLIVNLN